MKDLMCSTDRRFTSIPSESNYLFIGHFNGYDVSFANEFTGQLNYSARYDNEDFCYAASSIDYMFETNRIDGKCVLPFIASLGDLSTRILKDYNDPTFSSTKAVIDAFIYAISQNIIICSKSKNGYKYSIC